jgi:MFS family permease
MTTRVILAVCESCYLPAAGTLIGKYHRNRTISLATGIHLTGVIGGASLGGIGGWLAQKHGWRFPFELLGLVGIGYSGVLLVFLRDPKTGGGGIADASAMVTKAVARIKFGEVLTALFRNGRFVLALVFYALVGIAGWTFLGWMPAFLGEHFKLAEGKAGLIATGCLNGGALAGYLIGGVSADRWGRSNPAGRAWVGIIGLGLALPCVFVIATTGSLAVVVVALVGFGFSRALPDANIIPILFNITDSRHRATALGLLYAAGTTVGGALIFLGGVLRDAHVNITSVFYAGMIGMVMSAGLLWLIRPGGALPRAMTARNTAEG